MRSLKRRVCACALTVAWPILAWAQVTQRVSVANGGDQENGDGFGPVISADGRFVVFTSWATNLVPGDTNGVYDVFVRDRRSGETERVSISSAGAQANSDSEGDSISADGRFVVFTSDASNLVPGDGNTGPDVFVRDRRNGTTELISFGAFGGQSAGGSISADGRYVAFVTSLWGGLPRVYVRDRESGALELACGIPPGGQQPSDNFWAQASISADGRCVAFSTYVDNLVPGDTDGLPDVFVRDRVSGSLECVSVSSSGALGGRLSASPSMSADGRFVVFSSYAANLVPGDTNAALDVFVHDRASGRTERVSVDSSGIQGNGPSYRPSITADGRYVAFCSEASNLVPGDTNGGPDDFVHDRITGATERVNLNWAGEQGNMACYGCYPCISADGRFVAFDSFASNLVPGDTNGLLDVFLRDRAHVSHPSLCGPGAFGVIGCPCSNPPSGPGRGCDNSTATGGADLLVLGGEYLSSDSIVFATNGETPTGLSVVVQGASFNSTGAVYGQGIRCVAGTTKRLFTRAAVNGGMSVPDFDSGDPQVHERSAVLGDLIAAGSTRWYFVLYRDPVVLGGCSGSSRFNSTQTREILWLP